MQIVPAGVELDAAVEPLRYQREVACEPTRAAAANELASVRLRYKAPDADTSQLVAHVMSPRPRPMGDNLGFASAVAELGLLLRQSPHRADSSFEAVIEPARRFRGRDPDGYRAELIALAQQAARLSAATSSGPASD